MRVGPAIIRRENDSHAASHDFVWAEVVSWTSRRGDKRMLTGAVLRQYVLDNMSGRRPMCQPAHMRVML